MKHCWQTRSASWSMAVSTRRPSCCSCSSLNVEVARNYMHLDIVEAQAELTGSRALYDSITSWLQRRHHEEQLQNASARMEAEGYAPAALPVLDDDEPAG